jgi:putative tricarboxylic transport membrane protein
MRANDAICGLVMILLAALMIALAANLPAFPGQNYGPSLFPRILGSGLILCGSLLMWRGIAARAPGTPWIHWAAWTRDRWRVSNFLLMLALLLLYILVSETVGFIPLGIFFLGTLFLWFGVRPLTAVITAIAGTIVIHWFFSTLLRVPLPRGWLNTIL